MPMTKYGASSTCLPAPIARCPYAGNASCLTLRVPCSTRCWWSRALPLRFALQLCTGFLGGNLTRPSVRNLLRCDTRKEEGYARSVVETSAQPWENGVAETSEESCGRPARSDDSRMRRHTAGRTTL